MRLQGGERRGSGIKRPFCIGVGGAHSNSGKTTVASALLKHITTRPPFYPFTERPRTGAIKYTKTDLYSSITDDRSVLSNENKDTGRFLLAGAEEVQWVQAPPEGLAEVLPIAFDRLSHLDCIIMEGNSAIEFLKPDIVIFLIGVSGEKLKPSAKNLMEKADILIGEAPFTAGDEGKRKKTLLVTSAPSLRTENLIKAMEKTAKTKEIEKLLAEKSVDGRVPCGAARAIAEELDVPYNEVGGIADGLKIKIKNCELGCF